jgi:hypothetical protein
MRRYPFFSEFLFIALVLLLPKQAAACICGSPASPCQGYAQVEAIFVGTVVQIESPARFHIVVLESFKGVDNRLVVVRSGSSCVFEFESGKQYLVYAFKDESTGTLHTSVCTRTQPVETAVEDLRFLRGLTPSAPTGSLSGQVFRRDIDLFEGEENVINPLIGVKISVVGDEIHQEATTGLEGRFELPALPPGRYTVSAQLPSPLVGKSEEVFIVGGGCSDVLLEARVNGRIRGTIYGSDGQPISGIRVTLVPLDLPPDKYLFLASFYGDTKKDGTYSLGPLPAGHYLLGVNIKFPPSEELPFVPTFYPHGEDPSLARIIELHSGEELTGYDLWLSPRLEQRNFPIWVVWPEGEPPDDFTVQVFLPDYPWYEPKYYGTEIRGPLEVPFYRKIRYWIEGSAKDSHKKIWCASPLEIGKTDGTADIKLVLTMPGWKCLDTKIDGLRTTLSKRPGALGR